MFNVGILASRAVSLVRISDRVLPNWSGFWLEPNGVARQDLGSNSTAGVIAGEWYVAGITTGIGSQYEARWTLIAGAAPSNAGSARFSQGTWVSLSNRLGLTSFAVGTQVLVEIRRASDSVVVASAIIQR